MPFFCNYSPEELLSLLEPWINDYSTVTDEELLDTPLPPPQNIMLLLPKTKDFVIFCFNQEKNGLFFLSYDKKKKTPVTKDNCLDIYQKIMKPNIYLQLEKPLRFLPPKEIFELAEERFLQEIQTQVQIQLPAVLAKIIAEYQGITKKQISQVISAYGMFKGPAKQLEPVTIQTKSATVTKPVH